LARNLSKKARREIKRRKPAIVIASTDNSRLNIRSALGLQLLKLWMYDIKTGWNTRTEVNEARAAMLPLTYRYGNYKKFY